MASFSDILLLSFFVLACITFLVLSVYCQVMIHQLSDNPANVPKYKLDSLIDLNVGFSIFCPIISGSFFVASIVKGATMFDKNRRRPSTQPAVAGPAAAAAYGPVSAQAQAHHPAAPIAQPAIQAQQ